MGGLRKVGRPPHCFRFYQTKDPSYGANPTTPGKMKTYIKKKKRKTLPRQKIRHMGPTHQLLIWKHIWKNRPTPYMETYIYENGKQKKEKNFYPDKRSVKWGQPTNLPCQQLPILLNISSIRGNSKLSSTMSVENMKPVSQVKHSLTNDLSCFRSLCF